MNEPSSLKGKRVLVVDDEELIREMIKDEIRFREGEVFEAENGKLGLEIVKNNPIDIVISDIRMPNGDGIQLLKAVKGLDIKMPIVLLVTGYADINTEDAHELGAQALLQKPIDFDQLERELASAILNQAQKWARKSDRIKVDLSIDLKLPDLASSISSHLFNIGQGGFFLKIDKGIPKPGQTIEFKIQFNSDTCLEFAGRGYVRWARTQSQPNLPSGCGVEIEFLNDAQIETWIREINKLKPTATIPKA